jgi:perosamine synthetase
LNGSIEAAVLPYARQDIDEEDIAAVETVLRSDWLTTGPKVPEFETALAERVGARHGVAVSSGTAALHATMHALGIRTGDEVIVPAMTFAATANVVVFQDGTPVFADVDPATLLLDPSDTEVRITPRTKAIVAVDYAGHPADYEALRSIAERHGLALVSDACHALGARYRAQPVGSVADLTAFSFHPVKHVTTGEGGMVTTDDAGLAERMYRFRNHGITTDHRARDQAGSWAYEMVDLGYNYRLTDFQSALGLSQLGKLDAWLARRQAVARRYDEAFAEVEGVTPLTVRPDVGHAYHLYVVQLELAHLRGGRAEVYRALRDEGIGVNVHYIPVHLHPYYRERFGTEPGLCPNAEQAYERILTLPLFPRMSDSDVDDVVRAVTGVLKRLAA